MIKAMLWKIWGMLARRWQLSAEAEVFVVLGHPRSGTSLTCRLLEAAGISFGSQDGWKKADWRNPEGFYEHVEALKIDQKLIKESGKNSFWDFDSQASLRAQGFWNRGSRLITRLRMMRFLKKISETGGRWAFKEFPSTFYFWGPYLPQAKIVAIFREPRQNAQSITESFRRYGFAEAINHWTAANRELLYHLTTRKSLLIEFDDLADPQRRKPVLGKLAVFLNCDPAVFEKVFVKEHMPKAARQKEELLIYPLPPETEAVYRALQLAKER